MNNLAAEEHSPDHVRLLELIRKHPRLNLLPLIELVVEDEEPEYLESFCNETILVVSELLREDQHGILPDHIMRIIQQLHTLREIFRRLRGAPSWP